MNGIECMLENVIFIVLIWDSLFSLIVDWFWNLTSKKIFMCFLAGVMCKSMNLTFFAFFSENKQPLNIFHIIFFCQISFWFTSFKTKNVIFNSALKKTQDNNQLRYFESHKKNTLWWWKNFKEKFYFIDKNSDENTHWFSSDKNQLKLIILRYNQKSDTHQCQPHLWFEENEQAIFKLLCSFSSNHKCGCHLN